MSRDQAFIAVSNAIEQLFVHATMRDVTRILESLDKQGLQIVSKSATVKLSVEWFPVDKQGTFWIYGMPGTDIDFACVYAGGFLDRNLDWNICWTALRMDGGTTNVSEKFQTMWAAAQWCVE